MPAVRFFYVEQEGGGLALLASAPEIDAEQTQKVLLDEAAKLTAHALPRTEYQREGVCIDGGSAVLSEIGTDLVCSSRVATFGAYREYHPLKGGLKLSGATGGPGPFDAWEVANSEDAGSIQTETEWFGKPACQEKPLERFLFLSLETSPTHGRILGKFLPRKVLISDFKRICAIHSASSEAEASSALERPLSDGDAYRIPDEIPDEHTFTFSVLRWRLLCEALYVICMTVYSFGQDSHWADVFSLHGVPIMYANPRPYYYTRPRAALQKCANSITRTG